MKTKYVIEVERSFTDKITVEDLLKQFIVKKYKKDISFNKNLCYNSIRDTTVVDSN